jgi:hypothetical protein
MVGSKMASVKVGGSVHDLPRQQLRIALAT